MGFTTRAAVAGLLLGAAKASPVYGNGTIAYTTEVVTALTTYCPAPTTLTYNDKTYTITKATTLTITDCPCTISKPAKPAKPTATGPPKDACVEHCDEAYNKCRTGPGANMATCAAKYAECLGYSPFGDDGSLVTPTACSKKPAPTKPVYTTEVLTAITTYCPEPTTLSYNNKTYTITKPTTLTITDCPCTVSKPHGPAPSVPAHDCAKECTEAYNKCRTGPGANMATCAAKYSQCLGYSPFGDDGSLKTPTACSATGPAPTGPAPTGPAPTGPAPTGPAPPVVPGHDCAKECTEAYNKCRSGSGANMATCAAEYAKCLGYSPFGDDGSLKTPTACSATGPAPTGPAPTGPAPTGPAPPVVPGHDCAKECTEAYNKCRSGSGANMATCAAEYAKCLGYSPFGEDGSLKTPTACSATGPAPTGPAPTGPAPTGPVATPTGSNPPVVTAGAGRIAPAGMLVALGAIALF